MSCKVPKVVKDVRALFEQQGIELSGENLKMHLKRGMYKAVCRRFRHHLSPENKSSYKTLDSDYARRDWIAQWVMDPVRYGNNKGFNKTVLSKTEQSKSKGRWMHESEIAGPDGLNNPAMAKVLCASGDLGSRVSEYPALAKEGHHQYWYAKEMILKNTGTTQQAGVETSCELTPDEYKKVTANMAQSWYAEEMNLKSTGATQQAGVEASCELTPDEYKKVTANMAESFLKTPTKRKAGGVPKEAESSEKKARRARAVANNARYRARAKAMRKLKTLVDEVSNDSSAVEADLAKLTDKGYPEQMVEWCKAKIADLNKSVQVAKTKYTSLIGSRKSADERRKSADEAMQLLDKKYTDFQKESGAKIKWLLA